MEPQTSCCQPTTGLSIQDRLSLLETNEQRLEHRLQYSETLHRKVGASGDIYHYERIAPEVVKVAALGALVALALKQIYLYVRK